VVSPGRRRSRGPRSPVDAERAPDLAPLVGLNLRRLRVRRGLSLERLAQVSGVSRAMLGQIELGQSAPTINILWRIARALRVTFSTLIPQEGQAAPRILRLGQAKVLSSAHGAFVSRALFPFDEPRRVEFYELTLAAHAVEEAEAHPAGTVENLIVSRGNIIIVTGEEEHALACGDAILFAADSPHAYRNESDVEAVMYSVVTYADALA
jgi:transcriptional regulator with XRE-family HTH domain